MVSDVLVLCTRNRADDVSKCLVSIRTQTRVPRRVLVVDSSDDDATARIVVDLAQTWAAGSIVDYLWSEPALTRQRAAGIDATVEDIVHFVDDDTVLDRGYIEAIDKVFDDDRERAIGGVGGFITDQPAHRFTRIDEILGLDSRSEGTVLPSGRNVRVYTEPAGPIDVDWLPGCAMSYRRAVFQQERPNVDLGRDRNGEDVELSYRVRQHWRLVITPAARIEHHESAEGRRSAEELARIELLSRYDRVRARTGKLSRSAFWLSAFGQLGWYGAKGLITWNDARLAIARETGAAIKQIAARRSRPARSR